MMLCYKLWVVGNFCSLIQSLLLIMHSSQNTLSVREIQEPDFANIVDYFLNADKDFLLMMGVDSSKLPEREKWLQLLSDEYNQPFERKKFYYVIWLLNNTPIGHSNINKIIFGEEAYMHLHIWDTQRRQKGAGVEFIKMSLPYYFDKFRLKRLYCEPSASNHAPNKTLEKSGFEFVKKYETMPGWINLFQTVNCWQLDFKKYQVLLGGV